MVLLELRGGRTRRPEVGHAAAISNTSQASNSCSHACASSAAVPTGSTRTPGAGASFTFAATTVTLAPRRAASAASANPIRPEERLLMKRTLSIGSRVPPANRSRFTAVRGGGHRRPAHQEESGAADRTDPTAMREPLPQEEFDRIFSRGPRLTVELVIASDDRGVLRAWRDVGPCQGLWHLPGGTVRFGEPLVEAVKRVAHDELGVAVSAGETRGYIGYPSHYDNGLDSPVGLTFRADVVGDLPDERDLRSDCAWFTVLPGNMQDGAKGVPRSPGGPRPGMTTARTCAQRARRLGPTSRISLRAGRGDPDQEAQREALATNAADEAPGARSPSRQSRHVSSPPRLTC